MKKMVTLVLATICFALLKNDYSRQARAGDSVRTDKALSDATRTILEKSETFVLLSIDPTPIPKKQNSDKRERFHNRRVLGQTEIKDQKRKTELLVALYAGVEQYEKGDYAIPECFIPHHAIRAVMGTNWVDLVICFKCNQIVKDSNKGHA